jgi:hypothetical protein
MNVHMCLGTLFHLLLVVLHMQNECIVDIKNILVSLVSKIEMITLHSVKECNFFQEHIELFEILQEVKKFEKLAQIDLNYLLTMACYC